MGKQDNQGGQEQESPGTRGNEVAKEPRKTREPRKQGSKGTKGNKRTQGSKGTKGNNAAKEQEPRNMGK